METEDQVGKPSVPHRVRRVGVEPEDRLAEDR